MRTEQDAFGTVTISDEALYGIQTIRTVENMSFSGRTLSQYPAYIQALAQVKLACAKANGKAGFLTSESSLRIQAACRELIEGKHAEQFPVDVFHGGGSIGVNMNMNEVIARLAGEGIHPTDHVNASQSTADVCHTGARIAILAMMKPLEQAVHAIAGEVKRKAEAFESIRTIARTCWQDGMSVSLASLFDGFEAALSRRMASLTSASAELNRVNIGGTVIGSGVGAPAEYRACILNELREVTGLPLQWRESLYDAAQNPDDLARLSSEIRVTAALFTKFAKDLRLLSSGPEAGLSELTLPAVQAGSSFFPGKVNPVVPEMMIQCGMLVAGNDSVIQTALEMGEVHLNLWEGLMAVLLMQNIGMLTRSLQAFHSKCVAGIEPNIERCESYAESYIPMIVELKEKYGYQQVSEWVKDLSKEQIQNKFREAKHHE